MKPLGIATSALFAVLLALFAGAGCGRWADELACGPQGCDWTEEEWSRVRGLAFICSPQQEQAGTPCGVPAPPDLSNRYLPISDWQTGALKENAAQDAVVDLGRRLYYDWRLSGSATLKDTLGRPVPHARAAAKQPINVSCATCHDPALYGADLTSVPRHVSIGAGWYDVNGQQTLNAARLPLLYWNGRADSLWAQAAQVIESPVSMNGHRMKTFWVVVNNYRAEYAMLFPEALPLEPTMEGATAVAPPTWASLAAELTAPAQQAETEQYKRQYDSLSPAQQQTVTTVHVNASKAIGAYEWLLSSDRSPFDQFVNEGPQSTKLSPTAKRGLKLFVGKGSCVDCHSTPLLSDGKFHNIGIKQSGTGVPTIAECSNKQFAPDCDCVSGTSCLPWGAYFGNVKASSQTFSRRSQYSDDAQARAQPAPAPTPDESLLAAWRTPSLRDVAMTAPYMHNGVFANLTDVIWHYDQAGGRGAGTSAGRSSELASLDLTAGEREDLVAFLFTLTGTSSVATLPFNKDGIVAPPGGGVAPTPDPGQTVAPDAAVPAPDAQRDAGAAEDGR